MPWYVSLDSVVVIEDDEAVTEHEAIEAARQKLTEWLQMGDRPYMQLVWQVEREG